MMGDTLSFLPSLGPAGGAFVLKFSIFFKKNIKNQGVSIDESLRKKYINFHRRFTAALFFDRSGKEITD